MNMDPIYDQTNGNTGLEGGTPGTEGASANEASQEAPKQVDTLAYNQTKISGGRIVEMREANGSDEMVVAAQLGDVFEANMGGQIIFQSCMIARSITKIGEVQNPILRNYEDYRDFIAQFKAKDMAKLKALFDKLNSDTEGND